MIEPEVFIVRETYLSHPPAKAGLWVGLFSMMVTLGVSLVYWNNLLGLSPHLAGTREQVFTDREYWRLLTSIFVHVDIQHFLSNILPLVLLSYLLYGYFGPMVYPLMCLVLGAAVNGLALLTYPANVQLVGASGVVYLMAAFWLTLYILIERRFSLAKRLLRGIGFGMITLLPTTFDPTVSYRTHAIGFAAGICFGVVYFAIKKETIRQAEVLEVDSDSIFNTEPPYE